VSTHCHNSAFRSKLEAKGVKSMRNECARLVHCKEEEHMAAPQVFYWLLAGALIGFGLIGILSIGFPFLLVGCGMLIYGIIRFRFREFWAFLVGLGILPALILAVQLVGYPLPTCTVTSTGLSYESPPGTTSSGCYPPGYYTLAIFFGCTALLGGIWPLLRVLLRRLRTRR